MRIGMVCPYSFDVPGGVQAHVVELAKVLISGGHEVSVLAPSAEDAELPDFVVSTGKAFALPYNGSVARLSFGPTAFSRTRRWISDNNFDVLHLHEPNAPSLSMLALRVAQGPIVATFHTSTTKSLMLSAFQGVLRPYHEKINGRIAVSELARRWQVEALGSDAVEIPNGVDVEAFSTALPFEGYPRAGRTVLFLGRYDEPRKGMSVLIDALPEIVSKHPNLELLIVGRGDETGLRKEVGRLAKHLRFLGQVSEKDKASALRSADIYCAPNLGGESFGIVLVEAMASQTAVVASELDAFRRVLNDGQSGKLVPVGDASELARVINELLDDDAQRQQIIEQAGISVVRYDWKVVAEQIMRVYETVTVGSNRVTVVD
ncbi:MAG: glycosyltransferase family 4 protein [Mycobacteriaceae bacterium]